MKSRKELLEEFKQAKVLQAVNLSNNLAKKKPTKPTQVAPPKTTQIGKAASVVKKSLGNVKSSSGGNLERTGRKESVKSATAKESRPVKAEPPVRTEASNDESILNIKYELESKQTQVNELEEINSNLIKELERVKQDLTEYLLKQEDLERIHSQARENDMALNRQLNGTLRFKILDSLQQAQQSLLQKEALVQELTALVESLQNQVTEFQKKPEEYADYWINSTSEEKEEMELDVTPSQAEVEKLQNQSEIEFWTNESDPSPDQETLKKQLAAKTIEVEDALECINLLQKQQTELEKQNEELNNEMTDMQKSLVASQIMYDDSKCELNQLLAALEASLIENENLTKLVESQKLKLSQNEEDMQALFQTTEILENEGKLMEEKIREKELQIDNLQCDLFRVESVQTSEQIELDNEREMLISALDETCKENEQIHQQLAEATLRMNAMAEESQNLGIQIQTLTTQLASSHSRISNLEETLELKSCEVDNLSKICDSQHEQLVLFDFKSLNVNQMIESSTQTTIDVTFMNTEFKNIVKALKIAELSNNVMHQKNLALQEHYESIKGTLAKENEDLKEIVQKRQELEDKLLNGIEMLKEKCSRLEQELAKYR